MVGPEIDGSVRIVGPEIESEGAAPGRGAADDGGACRAAGRCGADAGDVGAGAEDGRAAPSALPWPGAFCTDGPDGPEEVEDVEGRSAGPGCWPSLGAGAGRFLFDGTNSWFAVTGALGAEGGGVGRGCTGWRMVAADGCVGPAGASPPGRAEVGVRTVAAVPADELLDEAEPPAEAPLAGTVGIARVLSLADGACDSPAGADETVGRSACSVPFPAPARPVEPAPVPARDT